MTNQQLELLVYTFRFAWRSKVHTTIVCRKSIGNWRVSLCRLIRPMSECLVVVVLMVVMTSLICLLWHVVSIFSNETRPSFSQLFIELLVRNSENHAIVCLKFDLESAAQLEKQGSPRMYSWLMPTLATWFKECCTGFKKIFSISIYILSIDYPMEYHPSSPIWVPCN